MLSEEVRMGLVVIRRHLPPDIIRERFLFWSHERFDYRMANRYQTPKKEATDQILALLETPKNTLLKT